MLNTIICFFFLALSAQGSFGSGRSPSLRRRIDQSPSTVRLVQYNVEWLFVDYYAPMDCPGEGCTWTNQSEAETHMKYVSSVVADLNPDILNLCEVEGTNELALLKSEMADGAKYGAYLIPGTDKSTGQNVALLSKSDLLPTKNLTRTEDRMAYPLAGSKCGYTGEAGEVGVSKHYITEFTLFGKPTLFVALHLLAYPEDPLRCVEREAQAQIIHNYIAEYLGAIQGEIILLGDFNDFDGEVLDANSNRPTSRVLDILKGKESGFYELRSAAERIGQTERFSDWWDQNGDCVSTPNEFSMIDHVLMTPFLYDRIVDTFVYSGYGEFCGKYNSDHYPLVVDFE